MSDAGGDAESGAAREVIERLERRGETLAVAESCTGGGVGQALTSVPGASRVFWGGVVAYSDDAKRELLGVEPPLLERHGAVSREVAVAMAEGVRLRAESTWGVAVTGVAGPGGGTPEKPVGTVWIALDGPVGPLARGERFAGDREAVRHAAVLAALDLVEHASDRNGGTP